MKRTPAAARITTAATAMRTFFLPFCCGVFTAPPGTAIDDDSPSANAMSLADWNRLSRSLSRQCRTICSRAAGMFCPDSDTSAGSSFRIADIVSAAVSFLKALLL